MRTMMTLLVLAFASSACAQYRVTDEKRIDTSVHVFYIGADNPVSVQADNPNSQFNLYIAGGGGTIRKESKDRYLVTVMTQSQCTLGIVEGTKIRWKRSYKIETLPDPVATVTGLRDTTISKNRLLNNPFENIVLPNCNYDHEMRVISFDITIISATDSVETRSNGNSFSQSQIDLIRQAVPGDTIFFSEIRVLAPGDRTRKLAPFWLRIQ
jgi:hypothetical protein